MTARIAAAGFDYVGISLDGLAATHDKFRRKAGVRFTLMRDNFADLPALLQLVKDEGIDRFYLSHLNYAGRGNKNRNGAAMPAASTSRTSTTSATCIPTRCGGIIRSATCASGRSR